MVCNIINLDGPKKVLHAVLKRTILYLNLTLVSKMNLLDRVRAALQSKKYRLDDIAAGSKVPYSTIKKIKQGTTSNPRFLTLHKLDEYFSNAEQDVRT